MEYHKEQTVAATAPFFIELTGSLKQHSKY